VRVDLHVHSMWSGDCTTTPEELAAGVAASGLDVLCLTDHNSLNGAVRFAESGELGCRVVVGEEVRTGFGEIIGLFLTERIPIGVPPAEVCTRIREQGGVVYIPHPYDPMRAGLRSDVLDGLVADGLVDAIEVRNAKTSLEHLNQQAADRCAAWGLAAGAGSDAHVADALGAAYVEMPDFSDPASFLASLRLGRVVGHFSDPARPWTPRIVPSTKAL
jgi:predicted metal-dependent phosphoesterase TrpH